MWSRNAALCQIWCEWTTIWSDEWAAYNSVAALSRVAGHGTVNHSLHFVDPTTRVNTQSVESYWNQVIRKFKRMMGVTLHQLALHLDDFVWRERYEKTAGEPFTNVCVDIRPQYCCGVYACIVAAVHPDNTHTPLLPNHGSKGGEAMWTYGMASFWHYVLPAGGQ